MAMMKRYLLGSLVVLLAGLAACSPRKGAASPDTAFAAYVKAYTGGVVSDRASIQVELNQPVPLERQAGGLFSFSPAVPGDTRWLSPTRIAFVPEEGALRSGTVYDGSFAIGQVLDIKEPDLQQFRFSFKVAEKTAALAVEGIQIPAGQETATIRGSIRLSEEVPLDQVVLTPEPAAAVELSEGGTLLHFEIPGLERTDRDRTLTLRLAVAGFKAVEPVTVTIPGRTAFKVLSARLAEEDTPYVEVLFSAPLAPEAAAAGFIELDGALRAYTDIQDNTARIYFEGRQDGFVTLTVNRNVRSTEGTALDSDFQATFEAAPKKPAVEIPLQGNILPDKATLVVPFRAVNLAAVDLRVIRIYESNVLSFLQENDLDGSDGLRRSGRLVYSRPVRLDTDPTRDLHQWNDFSIDLGGLFKQEPGALYRIRLSFRQEYSLYGKDAAAQPLTPLSDGTPTEAENAVWDTPNAYYWENFFDWDHYDWEQRDNPDHPSYYMLSERFPVVNLMTSDLGLLAEYAGGDRLWVAATRIRNAKPAAGTRLEVYDYQLQRIATAETDGQGLADIAVDRRPFVLVGRSGASTSYLRIVDGQEKALSRFDVGGQVVDKGLKGFIYGERGVWRPGDTLHVTLLLSDKDRPLPEGHPATLELYTPEGQFHTRMVRTGQDGFYTFAIPTDPGDPTGLWNAYCKVGGTAFHKGLRIETIKPNRLKVNLDLGADRLAGGKRMPAELSAAWLTGPAAAGLKAHATLTLSQGAATFPGFAGYVFRNPAATFTRSEHALFQTRLDAGGKASVTLDLPAAADAPGLLNAFIVTSVEEDGGDESFTTTTLPYSPFSAYVGVKFPEGDYLETGRDHPVRVAVVDAAGKRVSGHPLEYRVFKLDWRWWWESRSSELDSYVNGNAAEPVLSGTLVSGAQDATFTLRADTWGRYLVFVRDRESGHASGKVLTLDSAEYQGRSDRRDPDALTMITFSTDKETYRTGEKATVYVPSARDGQALVSLENGSRVLSRAWVATAADRDTPYTFTVTPEMAPNFYVHITLLQPYGSVSNDLPLRLYGVRRVHVEHPDSHLQPVIQMAGTIAPEEPFTIKVSEKGGRPMTYTLAIVDEGLLDLTAFKTPAPWEAMYRTEALGVKTWDLFDQVVGAYSGRFAPMLSVGGDQDNLVSARKDNRFNPVVRFLGPFTLDKGTATHRLQLPMYVGSVRVMVVAGHGRAYGNAEKTVSVQAPLMVLSSLPRTVCTGESVTLPVNVFALEDGIKSAQVSVRTEGPLEIVGAASQSLPFAQTGDQVVRFALKASGEGTARVHVTATGGSHKATETVTLAVGNPNPETVTLRQAVLEAGASTSFEAGDGATLELAGFPAVDATALFRMMKDYPYNCSEQLAARGLALLHLRALLPSREAAEAEALIPGLIQQLYGRQASDGGFVYWPRSTRSDSWVSSMAGAFLTEAAAQGFTVQPGVRNAWLQYQKRISQAYRLAGSAAFSELDECYRLYTLALAGSPLAGQMNRLKAASDLGYRARWMLAAAYAVDGKPQFARELITAAGDTFEEYGSAGVTYGSSLRDKAIALNALALSDLLPQALPLARDIARRCNDGRCSTQEAAFVSMTMDALQRRSGNALLQAEVGGQAVKTPKSVHTMPVQGTVPVRNTSDATLYATLMQVSRLPAGTPVPARASDLKLSVAYTAEDGSPLSPASLRQGTGLTATVTVTNPTARDYTGLALREPVPSGWEIRNERLTGDGQGYDHQDIRDDRCDWFFDLPHGQTRRFSLRLRAAYEGSYILPAITCEAMYDPHVAANTASGTVRVTR